MKRKRRNKNQNWLYATKVKDFDSNKILLFWIENKLRKEKLVKLFKKIELCKNLQKKFLLRGKVNAMTNKVIEFKWIKKIWKDKYFNWETLFKVVNKKIIGVWWYL